MIFIPMVLMVSPAVPMKVWILETGTWTDPGMKPGISGFTLVELLVVIVLIAILGSYAVLSLDVDQEPRELEATAQQIRQHLNSASQEAILSGYPVGLLVEDNRLVFLLVGDDKWEEQLENEALPQVSVTSRWHMTMQKDTESSDIEVNDLGGKIVPQALIYAEGYADPFSIILTGGADDSISYSISTDGSRLFSVTMLEK